MIRETFRCHTGILWDITALEARGLEAEHLFPSVIVPPIGTGQASSSPEQNLPVMERSGGKGPMSMDPADPEKEDALTEIFDQLKIARWWWILELFPVKGRVQKPPPSATHDWKCKYFINIGKGRDFPRLEEGHKTFVHRSVKLRKEHDKAYKWKARGTADVEWVD